MSNKPIVLFEGYSFDENNSYYARGSCTLIKGPQNIIVDTLNSWDGDELTDHLARHDLNPMDINFVVCTHGHSDHIGCNYLFKNALHIVGFDVSHTDQYYDHDFKNGEEYVINQDVKVIPTPGHTSQDVTVLVYTPDGMYAITGDLFECEADLEDDQIWKENSMHPELHEKNRKKILDLADFIIPGHGPMFKVPKV
ncbi:metallo-beta-lactamase domain-containing protein 1 [Aethina tumida]|uniref:metallo-beta-lactamase domain-containing protein 1 n=1 Tax=Aethina tumida TaxID=116153 RepID=UPI00096B372E|nr:metallo-beta-lactamase domain-containing protein 1 [Aethina tumida]